MVKTKKCCQSTFFIVVQIVQTFMRDFVQNLLDNQYLKQYNKPDIKKNSGAVPEYFLGC